MTGSKRRESLRIAGALLVLFGFAALTWCGVSLVESYLVQKRGTAAMDREIVFGTARTMAASAAPKEESLLGSISIPRVGVSSVILEGSDDHALALSVGHIPGTALPGRIGNVALAGHRDTFFRGLQNIREGDDILLTTPTGSHRYDVESMRIVTPEDVNVLDDIGRPVLTLVTCYPFHYIGSAPKRFIVRAHLEHGEESFSSESRRHQ